ncbi:polysaccharide biosynthesis/export family protein [Pseudobacteriovorax antillogorgiicola]|uniref:SLBB domain-containing protein n=1 Tax=Pseudobacteriovorax antillogorgiicola TaxID=1513793 RepID=A0A1Y6BUL4_9BACT|nr:polysaccharide biosynthesis/export family protein [Pseudobacteriovorax antillogorgiicola]TCS53886.1 SLBB domain-containing protein [Pseudobacteriovorax antillogorgiicola]SMF20985.1 SLBB domain-containing protein [Pseudobacteriovorax antillogorgiicola]
MSRWKFIVVPLMLCMGCAGTPETENTWQDITHAPKGSTFSGGNGQYVYAPGDVVEVYVHREPRFSGTFLIHKSGYIQLPRVGPVYAKDRTPSLLKAAIQTKLRPYVRYPKVTVSASHLSSYRVIFSGQVRKPGTYSYNKRTSLLEGLAKAGGVTSKGALVILIRKTSHGSKSRYVVNYQALVSGERGLDNLFLERGDLIFVN